MALQYRQARRSESAACRASSLGARTSFRAQGTSTGLRSARGVNAENGNPHVMTSATTAKNSRPLYAYASARHPGALADITNVSGPKTLHTGHLDKAGHLDKVKHFKQLQPPQEQPAAEPAPQERSAVGTFEDYDKSNVQNAAEYVPDIYGNLFQEESSFLPRPNYMDSQTDISAKMRGILIDWLIEVHMKYRLRLETLHLTVNLIDRYLTRMPVVRKRLQLVGVVAMFVAAKFEEIHPPALRDFVHITDNAYTKEDVLVMECTMLTTLNFQVMVPTASQFCDGLMKANGCDQVHREVVHYLLDLGLLDIRMLQYVPSHNVSAAILLSNELLGRSQVWPSSMVQHSRRTEPALRGCVEVLRQLLKADQSGTGQLQAVRKKFSDSRRHSVATRAF